MRRRPAAFLLILLALIPAVRLLWLSRDNPHLGFYQDDGLYWVTAKSIAEGSGYRIVSLPGEPHQTKYPPVFPALLALAWRLTPSFPANLSTAVWITWLPLPLIVLLSNALLARWGTGAGTRLAVCVALALNPYLAFFAIVLMSELWATCFLLAAMLLLESDSAGRWRPPLAGLLCAAAYLTKTVLAPLLVAAPLILLWRRQRRAAAVFAACSVPPALLWHAWAAAHRAPAPDWTWLFYLDYLGFWARDIPPALLPTVIYRNLGELFTGGGKLLLFQFSVLPTGDYLQRLVMLAAVVGVVRWTRRLRRPLYPLFTAGLFALLLVWDFPPGERFLICVLPLLLLGLWTELSHLTAIARAVWTRPERSQKTAAVVAAILLSGFGVLFAASNTTALWSYLPELTRHRREEARLRQPLYDWIARNTPGGALFFAEHDTTLYLHTGRRATTFHMPVRHFYRGDHNAVLAESAGLPRFALARRLDYLMLTPSDFELDPYPAEQRDTVRQALARDPDFHAVFESPAGTIVKIASR
jgi:hypothetical protein